MVDLKKAVQEALDRRKAATVLRHHPVLAPYVTEDCQLVPGAVFDSPIFANTRAVTLGPIRPAVSSRGVPCLVNYTCDASGPHKTWVYLDCFVLGSYTEWAWRQNLPSLIRRVQQEIETCSP